MHLQNVGLNSFKLMIFQKWQSASHFAREFLGYWAASTLSSLTWPRLKWFRGPSQVSTPFRLGFQISAPRRLIFTVLFGFWQPLSSHWRFPQTSTAIFPSLKYSFFLWMDKFLGSLVPIWFQLHPDVFWSCLLFWILHSFRLPFRVLAFRLQIQPPKGNFCFPSF